ncbi:MAG: hypothetical protein ACOCXP_02170 [Candidatus Dojkabacteria bacterium]
MEYFSFITKYKYQLLLVLLASMFLIGYLVFSTDNNLEGAEPPEIPPTVVKNEESVRISVPENLTEEQAEALEEEFQTEFPDKEVEVDEVWVYSDEALEFQRLRMETDLENEEQILRQTEESGTHGTGQYGVDEPN